MMRMTSATDPLRILLVEDSKGDAILIEHALKQAMRDTYQLKRVGTISSAINVLSEEEFDVALLDRSLPDVTEFSGLLSLQNISPKLPIIFLTAYKDEDMALKAIEQGAQDYLFKDQFDGHRIKRAIQYSILRKQFEDVLIVRANYDNLTGLANRMLFDSRLEIALAKLRRQGGKLGILYLDLDRFKEVNDTYGHLAGDRLLADAGRRLKHCLRPYDTAARLGGDEFAILIEGIGDNRHCAAVGEKIIHLFEEPFVVCHKHIDIHVSIGIVVYESGSATAAELLAQADQAMYEAKAIPGSHCCFYEDSLHEVKLRKQM